MRRMARCSPIPRVRDGPADRHHRAAAAAGGSWPIVGAIGWVYDKVLALLPHRAPTPLVST